MFSLRQPLGAGSKPVGIRHTRVDIHIGVSSQREYVTVKTGARDEKDRVPWFPVGRAGAEGAPESELRIYRVVEYLDIHFLGFFSFLGDD